MCLTEIYLFLPGPGMAVPSGSTWAKVIISSQENGVEVETKYFIPSWIWFGTALWSNRDFSTFKNGLLHLGDTFRIHFDFKELGKLMFVIELDNKLYELIFDLWSRFSHLVQSVVIWRGDILTGESNKGFVLKSNLAQ